VLAAKLTIVALASSIAIPAWSGCRFSYDDICTPSQWAAVRERFALSSDDPTSGTIGFRVLLSSGYAGYTFVVESSGRLVRLGAFDPNTRHRVSRKLYVSEAYAAALNRTVLKVARTPARSTSHESQTELDGSETSTLPELCMHAAEAAIEQWRNGRVTRRIINGCVDEEALTVLSNLAWTTTRVTGCRIAQPPGDRQIHPNLELCS
jgi:hypothetical protein